MRRKTKYREIPESAGGPGAKEVSPSFRLACDLSCSAEFLQKFFAQTVKTSVGHDEQQITRLAFGDEILRDCIRTGKYVGFLSERTHTFRNRFRIEAVFIAKLLRAKNAAEDDTIAERQCFRQRILKHFSAHGVGPRLKNRPEP